MAAKQMIVRNGRSTSGMLPNTIIPPITYQPPIHDACHTVVNGESNSFSNTSHCCSAPHKKNTHMTNRSLVKNFMVWVYWDGKGGWLWYLGYGSCKELEFQFFWRG